jgi:hypothetical protein
MIGLKKTHKKNKNKKRKYTLRKRKNGGEAVAAGGYGCIFKPALSCAETNKNKNKNGMISKLLVKENAFNEMEEIERVFKYIKKNPDNNKYFIINDQVSLCAPAPLTKSDLTKYDEMCKETKIGKMGITSKNINANLDKVNIITMLDGGEDLEKYWSALLLNPHITMNYKFAIFKKINTALIGLLTNGIVKLNKDGLYHLDIKASNILLGKDGNTRLIDWGTSFEYQHYTPTSPFKNNGNIPSRLFDRALFQFNLPFSIILFMDDLNTVIRKNGSANDVAKEIVIASLNTAGIGHFEYIIEMMMVVYKTVLNNPNFSKEDALQMIEDYIRAILIKYLDGNTFQLEDFFREVIVHNIDVYGFIMSYINLLLVDGASAKNITFIESNKKHKGYASFITNVATLIHDFCWSPKYAAARIPVNVLTNRLKQLHK